MSNQSDFQQHLDRAGVRYWTAREMFFKGASHAQNGLNTDPPRRYWRKGIAIALIIDELRARAGFACRGASFYRSPRYNRSVGGVRYSQHLEFNAADIKPWNFTKARLKKLKRIAVEMRNEGFFTGGIGGYNTFVHLDDRGYRASWGSWDI